MRRRTPSIGRGLGGGYRCQPAPMRVLKRGERADDSMTGSGFGLAIAVNL